MFTVTAKELAAEFRLENLTEGLKLDEVYITTSDVNRPGLQLAGFFDYFGAERVQVLGKVEYEYLNRLDATGRHAIIEKFLRFEFPCLIVCRHLPVFPEMIELAYKYKIPVLRTRDITSRFLSALISYLNLQLAPRITKHGVLVEVYGEGILILGESSVGKSETALELVKRGHRLVADDVVEIKKVSEFTLVGSASEIIRHFIEIRGIGILDVKTLFGVGSVKLTEKIDLVIQLEFWDEKKTYDRLGLEDQYVNILGIEVPSLIIPVKPGRNLAVIVEVAAMNNRQKKMGYNAARILNERLMEEMSKNAD